jgi:hypothetical protein
MFNIISVITDNFRLDVCSCWDMIVSVTTQVLPLLEHNRQLVAEYLSLSMQLRHCQQHQQQHFKSTEVFYEQKPLKNFLENR